MKDSCEKCDMEFTRILFALGANKNHKRISEYQSNSILRKSGKAINSCKCMVKKVYCDSCRKEIRNV